MEAMNQDSSLNTKQLQEDQEQIAAVILALARRYEGDCLNLLSLLRTLESLHREIREDLFQPTLPNSRRELYNLLKDIEEEGGWPYIKRMKLQALLVALEPSEAESTTSEEFFPES